MLTKNKYLALIKKSILLILLSSAGTYCYSQQYAGIDILIGDWEVKNHKLQSSYHQPKDMLDAFWGEWSYEKNAEAERWFEYSKYNPVKLRRQIQWFESEYEADRKNWDDIIATTGLVQDQKKDYLVFLKNENKLLNYYNFYYANKLHAVKMYGGNWKEEFAIECIEDFDYVFKEALKNVGAEMRKCVSAALSEAVKNINLQTINLDMDTGSENLDASANKFSGCIGKIPLRSITFALQSALKRQFIKEMNDAGTDNLVADYWWDHKIMGKKDLDIIDKVKADVNKLDFWVMNIIEDKVKESAAKEVVPKITEEVSEMFEKEFKKRFLDKGLEGTQEAQDFINRALKSVKKAAQDRTVLHIKNEMFISFEFFIENLQQYLTIREGNYNFFRTFEVDIAKYNHVKKCLGKRDIPATPTKMLEIMKKDKKGFLAWFNSNCNEDNCAEEEKLEITLDKLSENERKIDHLANNIMGQCSKISSIAQSARQAAFNKSGSDNTTDPNSLSENVQALLQQKISSLEYIREKAIQNSVSAGLYKAYSQNRALQTCDEAMTISSSPDETEQLAAAMSSLANMADATDYSSYVSSYNDECIYLGNAARQIQSDVLTVINEYNNRLAKSVKSDMNEADLEIINELYGVAKGQYFDNKTKLVALEDEMDRFKINYDLALTLLAEESKVSQLKMLYDRLSVRLDNARTCHKESGSNMHQIEAAISKFSVPGITVSTQPDPVLSGYSEQTASLLTEIESNMAEVQGYQTETENAMLVAQSCMNSLLEQLPESGNIEGMDKLADEDSEDEPVSGGGFVEISQDGGIAENQREEAMNPDVKEAMDDYYKAQRLSNYGTKGFNKHTMQSYTNNLLAQQRQQNAQAIQELNNLAIDMVRTSAEYYGNMIANKNSRQTHKTAEEKFADKYLSTDFYNKYYEGFNINPNNPQESSSGSEQAGGNEDLSFDSDEIVLMDVGATEFTEEYQTSLGEIDSQEAAAQRELGAGVPDYCVYYYYNSSKKEYEYTICERSEAKMGYQKKYGPATQTSCLRWYEKNVAW